MNPRMKHLLFSLFLVVQLLLMASGPSAEELALLKARRYGAEAKECLRVVDQDGAPVAGATIWGGLQTGDGYNDYTPICGMTNTNGEYVIQGKCTNRIRCDIVKDGFYRSEFLLDDYAHRHSLKNGEWHPYGEMTTIVLKRIINPVGILRAKSDHSPHPRLGEWVGYDIERRQWVHPFGEGLHSDMLVKITVDAKKRISDFKAVMEVSFTNNPYSGAYILRKERCSDMKSVYMADTNASYQTSFVFVFERHPIIEQKPFEHVAGVKTTDTRLDADSYLVFRTRTKVDSEGRLVSAHYGKIYGLWEFFEGMRVEYSLFNPNPNDPNLEDRETAERSCRYLRQLDEMLQKKD